MFCDLSLQFLVSFPRCEIYQQHISKWQTIDPAYLYMSTIRPRLQVMGHPEAGSFGREVQVVQSMTLPLTPKLVMGTYTGVGVVRMGQAFEAWPGQKCLWDLSSRVPVCGVHDGNDSLVLVVTLVIKNVWLLTLLGSSNYVKWSLKSWNLKK